MFEKVLTIVSCLLGRRGMWWTLCFLGKSFLLNLWDFQEITTALKIPTPTRAPDRATGPSRSDARVGSVFLYNPKSTHQPTVPSSWPEAHGSCRLKARGSSLSARKIGAVLRQFSWP